MKAYIYFLSLLLVFAPVYANAILPSVVAVAGSTSGRVVLTKTGGAVLRKIAPSALSSASRAITAICAKNNVALAICGGVIAAIKNDGWNIDIDVNDEDNVEIYKNYPINSCRIELAYKYNNIYYYTPPSAAQAFVDNVEANKKTQSPNSDIDVTYDDISQLTSKMYSKESELKQRMANGETIPSTWSNGGNANFTYNIKVGTITNKLTSSLSLFYRCLPYLDTDKYYIDNNYLTNLVTRSFSDDDVTNIYNYDYSQHTTIKLNGSSESGDNVNNKIKNDSDTPDKNLSDNAANKSKDKNSDYHPDKINDENCSKDDMGRYDKCGADRDNDDTASTTDPTTPPTDDEEPPPIECNANGFYKKVCDWMDWTQEEPTKPTDDKPPVKDIEAEDTQKIDMDGACPAPYELNFSIFGYQQNNSISYQPLCNALEMLKPVFVGAGALSSMFILLGYSRQSGAGGNQ